MEVGNLVRPNRPGFESMIGLIHEVQDEGTSIVVEWMPEALPLIPMIETMNHSSLEVISEAG